MENTTPSYDVTKYERPSVTVDVLVFTIQENELNVLLIKRNGEPFKDMWAIPGGFVRPEESLEAAAIRELSEEAGVTNVYLEQLYTFGEPHRDPRTRVITVAYFALIPSENIHLKAGTDASNAMWAKMSQLPPLAFDHATILNYALERLRTKLNYSNIAYGLLPESFRLSQLQKVYEIILDKPLDKRNFRKWIVSLDLVEPTGETEQVGPHRPAQLYRFKQKELIHFD